MRDLVVLAVLFVLGAALYKYRARIVAVLRRFDERNARRRFEELRDRYDGTAHYKHTLRLAEEQVEEVTTVKVADERTGMPVTRYLFQGKQFVSRSEAEAARREAIAGKARDFYVDLDKTFLGRRVPTHEVHSNKNETKH